ncbi:universal stress protein [Streptomyces antimycoticus]|uniref:Universal stress protein n=1 Tax=Streptomyces antimycoticus TaxID=68175 RepID=A0A4D4K3P3_9ACTN|nr:universal stress protein [Streptomyces antimycoticus]GDY41248.1 universal stress protein [Streptomyces antimycoticus]
MTFRHVAVGVDGSVVAVRALDWATEEALRRGTALRIVYAVTDRDEAGPVLASAAARVHQRHPDLPVETRAVEGGTVRAMARESERAVLTVVGTRGLGGVTGLLVGSVSLRLAAHAHGPLLVVRGDHPCVNGREVLLGLESNADADAAAYAFQEAERRGTRLRVLHSATHRHITSETHRHITSEPPSLVPVVSPDRQRKARNHRAEEAVERFSIARLREECPEVDVDSRAVRTGLAHALLAASSGAGVVIIGAHRRAGRLGPVAHTLLHHSHCPVVLVPTA